MQMTQQEKIKLAENEITAELNNFKAAKKKFLYGAIGLIPLLFIYPYLSVRLGSKPLIEQMEYADALIFILAIWTIILPISFFWIKNKHEKKLKSLNIKKRHLEEGNF